MESWGQLPCTFAGAVERVTAGAALRSGWKIQATIQSTPLDKPRYATCMGYLGTTMYAWDSTLQEVPKSTKFKRYLIWSKCVLSSQQLKTRSWLHKLSGRPRASSYLVISLSYPAFANIILITYRGTLHWDIYILGSPTYQSNDWLWHVL